MSDHVIVLPGGGYQTHAPHEAEPFAEWLRDLGVASSVVRYPTAELQATPLLDAPVTAIRAAVREVRAAGAARVALLGFSAGGHAAGYAALAPGAAADERVDAAILAYPVVSMELPTHAGSRHNLLGDAASAAELRAASLDRLVTPDSPSFFIWHTVPDDVVPPEHAYLLGRALAAAGVPHELHVFPEGGHGLGFASDTPGASEWPGLCADWLRRGGWIA